MYSLPLSCREGYISDVRVRTAGSGSTNTVLKRHSSVLCQPLFGLCTLMSNDKLTREALAAYEIYRTKRNSVNMSLHGVIKKKNIDS